MVIIIQLNLISIRDYVLEDGKEILIDVYDKTKDEIYDHLVKVIGKSKYVTFVGLFG